VLARFRLPLGDASPDGTPTCDSQHDPGEDSSATGDECANREHEHDRTHGNEDPRTFKELQ
jgi:hypothetical protein